MSERIVFDDSDGASLESTISAGNGVDGLVVNLEEDIVKAMILGDTTRVKRGCWLKARALCSPSQCQTKWLDA